MDTRSFFRERLASPTLLIGSVFALSAGLSFGSFLKAGELFLDRPAPQVVINAAVERAEPVSFMTDAQGRIPTYVIGTDRFYQPAPLPAVRVAWDEPMQVIDDVDDLPTLVRNETPISQPAAYSAPPSEGGDILAVSTSPEPAPHG